MSSRRTTREEEEKRKREQEQGARRRQTNQGTRGGTGSAIAAVQQKVAQAQATANKNRKSTDTRANSGKSAPQTQTAKSAGTQSADTKNRKSTDTRANSGKSAVQHIRDTVKQKETQIGQKIDLESERVQRQYELLRLTRRNQAMKANEIALDNTYGVKTPWPSFMSRPAQRGLTPDEQAEIARLEQNIEALRVPMQNGGTVRNSQGVMWGVGGPTTWEQVGPGAVKWHNEQVANLQSQIDAIKARVNETPASRRDDSLRGKTPMDFLEAAGWTKLRTGMTPDQVRGELRDTRTEEARNRERAHAVTNQINVWNRNRARQQSAANQTLSRHDNKLRKQVQQEIKLAKADFDRALKQGDAAGMQAAHQRAETWRRIEGGYSGGATGMEHIVPKLDQSDISTLNKTGQRQLRSAKLGYENAQTDAERARYAAMGQDIRRNPAYQKETYDRGAYRETDANGRMRYAGTAEERAKEAEQGAAIPKAIGTGIAGSFLSLPGTTARALQADAARNQAALQRLSDIRGGGQVNISEPERLRTGQEILAELRNSERYQNANAISRTHKLARAMQEIKNEVPLGQRLLNRSDIYREKATEGQTGLNRYLTEALITGGEMIPGLAATALTGGLAAPGLAVMGAQAAGRRMGELEGRGEDPVRAFNRGLATGLIEAATERVPLGNLTKIAKGGGKSFARNMLTQALEEVGTEELSEVGNYAADRAFGDKNASLTAKDLRDTAVISLLTSLGMGAGAGIVGSRRTGRTAAQTGAETRGRTEAGSGPVRQTETPSAEDAIRTREAQLQAREKDLDGREQEALEQMARNTDSDTYYNHFRDRLAQVRQEQAQVRQERLRLAETRRQAEVSRAEEQTRQAEAERIAAESRYRPEAAREAGAALAEDQVRRVDRQAQAARERLNGEVRPTITALRDTLRGAAEQRAQTGQDRQTAPVLTPLEVPERTRARQAEPVQETEREEGQKNTPQGAEDSPKHAEPKNQNGLSSLREHDILNLSSGKKNKIVSSFQETLQFVRSALKDKTTNLRAYMGKVPSEVSAYVLEKTGIDIAGYNAILQSDNVRHIIKKHGDAVKELKRNQSPVIEDDIAMIPQILASPDDVTLSPKPDSRGRKVLIFGKSIGDYYVTLQAVTDGNHSIQTDTLYKQKKNPQNTEYHADENADPTHNAQSVPLQGSRDALSFKTEASENGSDIRDNTSSKGSIPQTEAESNGKFDEEAENVSDQEPYSVGAAPGGFDPNSAWQESTDRFHPINPRAEQAEAENWGRAPVDIPVRDPYGQMTSKAASTLINAGMTPNEISDAFTDMTRKGQLSYLPYTDDAASQEAERVIREQGFQRAKEDWLAEVRSGKMSKDLTTRGIVLYNNAANAGAVVEAIDIATDLIEYAHTAGQVLQAVNIINKLGPAGQLYSFATSMDKLEQEIRKRQKKDGAHWDGIQIDKDLAKEYVEAETDEERQAIETEIKKDIARQIPNTIQDKLDAWRYMAMLGNPRTQIRNLAGNLGFQPVRIAKNAVGAALERAVGLDQSQRTKSLQFKALSKADRARYQAGLDEYAQVESTIMGNGKYNDTFSDIDQYRRIFKLKFLEGWRQLTNAGLEKGDVFFAKRTYADSLAGVLKARGITAEEYADPGFDPNRRAEIQGIAVTEAQKATYRDLNQLSELVSGLGKRRDTTVRKVGHYLTEGLLPFKKTPANILVRGVEYSPIGLLKGLKDMGTKVKRGEMTAAEGLDEIASGLTGTGLLGLGVALAAAGLVTAGDDDDSKQAGFDELLGRQSYALRLPGGYSFTLDWMAPEAIPFFMGVELQDSWDSIREGKKGKDVIWNFVRRLSDPILEMSMMQSVNELIENVSYADNKIANILATLATGYLSQFIPTIGGQLERTLEDRRYSTWIDRDSPIPSEVQYLLGKNLNKIPGVEYHQREYLNAWGEPEMTGNPLLRALTNFASPGYLKKEGGGEVEKELQRLYDAGFADVFPTKEQTSTKINDEYVTAEQFNLLQGTKGQMTKDFYARTIASPEYQALSDADKAKVLEREAEYARSMGQVAAGRPLETLDAWAKNTGGLSESTGIGVAALIEASGMAQAINAREGETSLNKALAFYDYMDKKKYSAEQQDALTEAYFESNEKTRGYADVIRSGAVSRETMEQFLKASEEFDVNNKGTLDQTEVVKTLQSMGLPHDTAKAIFEAAGDKNEDGTAKTTYEDKLKAVEKADRIEANKAKADEVLTAGLSSERKEAFLSALPSGKALHDVTQQQMVDAFKAMGATRAEETAILKAINTARDEPWKTSLDKIIKSKW